MRPSTPKAPTVLLPSPPLRLLPGKAIQFPNRFISHYGPAPFTARRDEPPQVVFRSVLEALPTAWQFPADTTARIEYFGRTHALPDFIDTPWRLRSPISIWRTSVGPIEVHYKQHKPDAWGG